MKKSVIALLVTTVAVVGIMSPWVSAAEENISITKVYAEDGMVFVETINSTEVETEFMLLVEKNDSQLYYDDSLYAVYQQMVSSGETAVFEIPILDENNGIPGSGTYTVKLQSKSGVRDTETFAYADSVDAAAFLEAVKTADREVVAGSKAYEMLMPVVFNGTAINKGVFFALGLDYEDVAGKSEEVQKNAMNYLHQSEIANLTFDTFAEVFSDTFALAIYNSGEKAEGLAMLAPIYHAEKADAVMQAKAIELLDENYSSIAEFESAAKVACGLSTINSANVNNLGERLSVFATETGECTANINKITNLAPLLRYRCHEYIIIKIAESDIKSVALLATLLDEGYAYVTAGGSTGTGGAASGGGSTGGGGGGSADRTPVTSGSVSMALGSGTADEKNDITEKMLFADMTESHWAAESVLWMKDKGIVNGTDAGTFEPDRSVTREEFTKMIVLACGISVENQTAEFTDLQEGAWYIPYIGAAVDAGIVSGIGNNLFGIGQNITRQDMAVMVKRALDTKGITIVQVKDYVAFADEPVFAGYAMNAIIDLYEAGVINGKGGNTFDPVGHATRAEAAKVIYEAFQ